MALVANPFGTMYELLGLSSTSVVSATLDAVDEVAAFLVQVPKSGTIDRIHFRAGTTSGDDSVISGIIETVNTSTGAPSGSAYGGCVAGTVTYSAGGNKVITLATPATATAGNMIAIRLTQTAESASTNIVRGWTSQNAVCGWPRFATDLSAGSWTFVSHGVLTIGLQYSDDSRPHIYGTTPMSLLQTVAYQDSTAVDEYGIRFVPPGPVRLSGMYWRSTFTTGATITVTLYSGATSTTTVATLASFTSDSQQLAVGMRYLQFSAPVVLTAGTLYVIGVRSTGANVTLARWEVDSNAELEPSAAGKDIFQASRDFTGGGATSWTFDDTMQPFIMPIFDQIDDGAGGGGGGGILSGALTGGRQI